MTQYEPKSFTITDPRTFDGDPYTVAQRAAEQAAALTKFAAEQTALAHVMARNAWMETELGEGRTLTPEGWENTPYRNRWADAEADLRTTTGTLITLGRAAGYDPKHPPKES